MSNFLCAFCTHRTTYFATHVQHRLVHTVRLSEKYHCGYEGCKYFYNNERSLRTHIRRSHNVQLSSGVVKGVLSKQAECQGGMFICSIPLCSKELGNYSELSRHMAEHINSGSTVTCPFENCNLKYRVVQSWRSHVSRKHRSCLSVKPPGAISEPTTSNSSQSENLPCTQDMDTNISDSDVGILAGSSTFKTCAKDSYLNNLALLFLEMEVKLKIPRSSIDKVAKQLQGLHQIEDEYIEQILGDFLIQKSTPETVQEALQILKTNNLFANNFVNLSSSYKRNQYYKKNLNYVPPVQVSLGNGKFYHYISPLETIKSVVKSSADLPVKVSTPGVLKDINDGSLFRGNSLLSDESQTSLQLIFFQDAFEVVNPLGSSHGVHKVVGFYFMIGNNDPQDRSHLDSIYLVALCTEKNYNQNRDAIARKIVNDLKILETTGVCLDSGETLKGTVFCFCGDNLGSHGLGGFTENFSTSKYFCRFCMISRAEFITDQDQVKFYPKRTMASHECNIQALNRNQESYGVKCTSVFNELKYYHVCAPGLPPCLAHDLLEGVIAYDLALYLRDLVERKHWLSYKQLNDRINNFAYSVNDSKDKPKKVSSQPKRIPGSASEVKSFLRLLPLIISDKIKEDDETWRNILLLLEICEIVCAPVIHKSVLPYLELLIAGYIEQRVKLFPKIPLRAKHHYLTHYPDLISIFGPLIHVWTLRFEAKHSFFKCVLRSCKNFKNVTSLCSEKHQLFMAYNLGTVKGFGSVSMKNELDFHMTFYCEAIQSVIQDLHLPNELSLFECTKATYKGTSYEKGSLVVISQHSNEHNIRLGIVRLLISDGCQSLFLVTEGVASIFVTKLRAYRLSGSQGYWCVNVKDLVHYQPLKVYNIGGYKYAQLHHAITSSPIA